jgi:hypothetical protein
MVDREWYKVVSSKVVTKLVDTSSLVTSRVVIKLVVLLRLWVHLESLVLTNTKVDNRI